MHPAPHAHARRTCAALVAVLAAVGCSSGTGGVGVLGELFEPAAERSDAYQQTLEAWTRTGKVPDRADTALAVTATMKSAAFREQYVREYARAYDLAPGKVDEILASQRAEAAAWFEFHLVTYAPERRDARLGTGDGTWQVYLELAGGERVPPARIERVRGHDRVVRGFYPYMDTWSRAYAVRFPKPVGTDGPVRLLVTGVLGRVALDW